MGQPGKKNFKGQEGSTLGRPNQMDIAFISFKPRLRFGTEILFSPVDQTLFFTQNQWNHLPFSLKKGSMKLEKKWACVTKSHGGCISFYQSFIIHKIKTDKRTEFPFVFYGKAFIFYFFKSIYFLLSAFKFQTYMYVLSFIIYPWSCRT